MAAGSLGRLLVSKIATNQVATKGFLKNGLNVNFYSVAAVKNFEFIKAEKAGELKNVGLLTLNRPKVYNAFNTELLNEVTEAFDIFENDKGVGAIVLTGNEKFFTSGLDINETAFKTYSEVLYRDEGMKSYYKLSENGASTKPVIAAVNGLCYTVGMELSMLCDIIYAGENAIFSQKEILFGLTPGGGGTQRLTRAVGKSKAMEIVLTGRDVTAHEAEKMGLVSKVFPTEKTVEESIKLAEKICKNSQLINAMCKESVNMAFETTLREGLHFEKRMFHGTFATKDRKEGMTAFIEKRPPKFTNE